MVVGEFKSAFSLELVLQGVNRTAACDEVWLAVRATGHGGRIRDPRAHKLCRFLGFGLLGVSSIGSVEVLVEPKPWRPRQDPKRRARLVQEHRSRVGDPALGGSTKMPIMTAYRQQALACAASLAGGPRRPRDIRSVVPNASSILLRNVYGWFARIERGVYGLTPRCLRTRALAPTHNARPASTPEPKPLRNVRCTERVLTVARADGFRSAFETDRRGELHSTESKCRLASKRGNARQAMVNHGFTTKHSRYSLSVSLSPSLDVTGA